MNTVLSQEQIEDYQRDGFVAQRGFLSPEEAAELKEAVLETLDTMGSQKVAGNDTYASPEEASYYDKVFTQRLNREALRGESGDWRDTSPARRRGWLPGVARPGLDQGAVRQPHLVAP